MPVSSLLRALDAGVVLRLLVIEDDERVERGRSELNVDRNDPLESRNDTCAQEKVGKNASEVSALSKDVVEGWETLNNKSWCLERMDEVEVVPHTVRALRPSDRPLPIPCTSVCVRTGPGP